MSQDENYLALLDMVKEKGHLDFSQYRSPCIQRRIQSRMFSHKVNTYQEYLQYLQHNPLEMELLLKALTVNVTEFFRDKTTWNILANHIIPNIIEKKIKKDLRHIRIWSAGCSSGEETYSLAMLFHEILGTRLKEFTLRIYGTDIDKNCLEQAKKGCYSKKQIQTLPSDFIHKYIDVDSDDYLIKENLRDIISFQYKDLNTLPLANIDMIICRNVLIYFTRELQTTLLQKFHTALRENGFLILGRTESILSHAQQQFDIINAKERIYQKK